MKRFVIILIVLFTFFVSDYCVGQNVKQVKNKSTASVENFDSFFTKFFKDSLFQLSRINWPLEGGKMVSYEFVETWNKSTFKNLSINIKDKNLSVEKNKISAYEYEVTEYLDIKIGNAGIQYIFTLKNKIWKLTSYIKFAN